MRKFFLNACMIYSGIALCALMVALTLGVINQCDDSFVNPFWVTVFDCCVRMFQTAAFVTTPLFLVIFSAPHLRDFLRSYGVTGLAKRTLFWVLAIPYLLIQIPKTILLLPLSLANYAWHKMGGHLIEYRSWVIFGQWFDLYHPSNVKWLWAFDTPLIRHYEHLMNRLYQLD